MNIKPIPALDRFTTEAIARADNPEAQAHAKNFRWDERPPQDGVALYGRYFPTTDLADLDAWNNAHEDYARDQLYLDREEPQIPWTFRAENAANRLKKIEPRLYLLRVEEATWPCDLNDADPEELDRRIQAADKGDAESQTWLERFTERWNEKRDQRPLFATTEIEVEDLLDEPDWAERLRNYLGLGHYCPADETHPETVILMRYTVAEVIDALAGAGHPAAPSVLDGGLSPYFFPSPKPGPDADGNPYYGHTLNLGKPEPGEGYRMGVELLHPRLDWLPKHLYRVGHIARPFSQELTQARALHLPELQLFQDREDFGTAP